MKKRLIFFSCIAATLLLYGCDKHDSNTEKAIYNTMERSDSENVPVNGSDDNESEPDDNTGLSNIFSHDFKGITSMGKTPKAANSPFANISAYGTAPILSYDKDSDTLYYVNYGGKNDREKDYFLYSYRGGVRELLIEMPVNYPNYQNGSIYFISNEDIDALYAFMTAQPEGKLYRYDVTEKTIEPLVDENVFNLVVYEDYIYYTTSPAGDYDDDGNYIQKGWKNFRLSTSSGEPEAIGDFLPFFYGEYQLRKSPSDQEGLYFMELVSDDSAVRITGDCKYFADQTYCIEEDKFWIKYSENEQTQLASVNLRNGETKIYQHGSDVNILTYAVLDGELFAIFDDFRTKIVRYNSDNETFVNVDLPESHARPTHISTAGNYIYVLYEITKSTNNGIYETYRHLFLSRLIPIGDGKYEEEAIY